MQNSIFNHCSRQQVQTIKEYNYRIKTGNRMLTNTSTTNYFFWAMAALKTLKALSTPQRSPTVGHWLHARGKKHTEAVFSLQALPLPFFLSLLFNDKSLCGGESTARELTLRRHKSAGIPSWPELSDTSPPKNNENVSEKAQRHSEVTLLGIPNIPWATPNLL